MKFVRFCGAALIFLIACPLSWVAAWDVSGHSFFAVIFSVILPTLGGIYWVLVNSFGRFFGIGLVSFVLAFGGAFLTASLISLLLRDKEK